jgi:thymidine phosphorylase
MAIARVAMRLGAARERVEGRIDPAVGLTDIVPAGTRIAQGGALCRLQVNDDRHLAEARELAREAFVVKRTKPRLGPLVREEIG